LTGVSRESISGRDPDVEREDPMVWYTYLAYLGAGALLANAVPHFVAGISGSRFQSPFASPPGVGESSPLVNVLWGATNLVLGWLLLFGVGEVAIGITRDCLMVLLGVLATGVGLAIHFGSVRGSS
jgi:hypothetical protein